MRPPLKLDPKLREWASPAQAAFMDAIDLHGGLRAASRALGRDPAVVSKSMKRLRERAARQGYSPDHDMKKPVPDGYLVKGVSTYYDKEGNAAGQWVKSSIDRERQLELLKAAAEAMAAELPRLIPLAAPPKTLTDLLNLYIFTDYHLGMLAWHKEAGEDWDISIAVKLLVSTFEHMIAQAPAARVGLIGELGDFLHYDSLTAVTPTHGHVLDADGRFSKMVAAAITVLRRLVDIALQKHEIVIVVLAEGNHDPASAVWLRHMFKALYENEPRVKVVDSELPFYVHQHGNVMLGFHHGHMVKNASLPLLFAAQYPEIWGTTSKRYIHTGHRHHVDEKEHPGVKVIQHPTLAARDAYAARGGWISEREATAVTYHSKYGRAGTVTVTPEMIAA